MEYRNKKTGFSFFSDCKIIGDDWEVVSNEVTEVQLESTLAEPLPDIPVVEPELKESIDEEGVDGITKKDIMQELDAMGIKYNSSDKKQKLYDLMMPQGE